MRLDPEAIREYQEAHIKDTGEEISYEDAAKRANELLELTMILMQPFPADHLPPALTHPEEAVPIEEEEQGQPGLED